MHSPELTAIKRQAADFFTLEYARDTLTASDVSGAVSLAYQLFPDANRSTGTDDAAGLAVLTPRLALTDWRRGDCWNGFIRQVISFHACWQVAQSPVLLSLSVLQRLYARHKYLLMAQDPASYQTVGRLLSSNRLPVETLLADVCQQLQAAMLKSAQRGRYVNALQHVRGYVKNNVAIEQRQMIDNRLDQFRTGVLALTDVVTPLRHMIEACGNTYLSQQLLLSPLPECID